MHSLFDLNERVIVVTGAAGAFGSAIAEELVARGCRVSLFDRDADSLKVVMQRLESEQLHFKVFDATDEESCVKAFQESSDRWSRIDGFVNCVGAFEIVPATEMPISVFSHVLETNLHAAFILSRIAAKHMIPNRYGRIVNISSVSDSIAIPGYAAYAASKAGLTHLTRVLAKEWVEYSITVNSIGPAISETRLTNSFLAQGNNREDARSRIPMKRFFEPSDLLGTVILLLAPGGSFITGQDIHIDGGRLIS